MAGDVAVVKRLVPCPEHGRPRTVVVAAVTGVVVTGTCSEHRVRYRGFTEIFGVKFGDQGQVSLCRLVTLIFKYGGAHVPTCGVDVNMARAEAWRGILECQVCSARGCVCVCARVDVCASRVTPARPAVTLLQPQLSKLGKDNEKL